jgi:uncharacterized BrkB/YihY/UPF0761 family membrane protein
VTARVRRAGAQVIDLYWGEGVCDDVPALAWFLLGALVPLALGMTAAASIALGDYAEAQAAAERAAQALPAGVSDQVVQLILRTRRDSPVLVLFSIVVMVWTSAGAVGVVERSMSRQLERARAGPFALKLKHLALAGQVTILLVLMVLAGARATDLQQRLGFEGLEGQALLIVTSLATTALVCTAVYRFGPMGGVRWRSALTGAAPAALIVLVTPTVTAAYLSWASGTTPLRVFLTLAGIFVTCYVAAFAILVGAAIAVRAERRAASAAATA